MPKDIKQFTEEKLDRTRGLLQEGQEISPMLFALKQDDSCDITVMPFGGEESKDAAAVLMRLVASLPDVVCCVFITDAWVAEMSNDEYEKTDMSKGVKNVPGRREALVCTVFGKGMKTSSVQQKYDRKDGKIVFDPPQWFGDGQTTGRFAPDLTDGHKSN